LEAHGQVQKTYGGVISKHSDIEIPFNSRSKVNIQVKERIGQSAAQLVEDGDSIIIDSSSSCYALVRELLVVDKKELTIFCTGLASLTLLSSYTKFQVFGVGGLLLPQTLEFVGHFTRNLLENIHVEKYFAGITGIHPDFGITDPIQEEVAVKQKCAQAANETIILADQTKFGRVANFLTFKLDQINLIVTDVDENHSYVKAIQRAGVEFLFIPVHES
jgi:DeoR/GlpR family transcriptional regulator of sugar metabolism